MSGLDFRRPEQCSSLPLITHLKASSHILLQQILPMKWSLRLSLLGRQIEMWTNPERRDRVAKMLASLGPASPDRSELARQIQMSLLARRMGARSHAIVARRSREWLLRTLRPDGLDTLEAAHAEQQGAIILATHAGMNTWMPAILMQLGFPLWLTQRKKVHAQTLLLLRRDKWVSRVLPFPEPSEAGSHLKRILDLIRRGDWVEHVADYPDHKTGLTGTCCGITVRCRRAPWALGRLSGAPLIPVLVLLEADLSVRLIVGPTIRVDPAAPAKEAMTSGFQRYLDFVESAIRPRPWNLYVHLLARSRTMAVGLSPPHLDF